MKEMNILENKAIVYLLNLVKVFGTIIKQVDNPKYIINHLTNLNSLQ